jgi:threonylcarbamoyladenosine tRNA methylthiotransferase MtaB
MERVVTFGCRLNSFESEVIKENLKKSELDDVIVLNTCAVTKETERQVMQTIRKIRRAHPEKKIFVTGCAAQIDPHKYATMQEVDRVLGNEDKFIIDNYDLKKDTDILVTDIMTIKETAAHLVHSFENQTRAFIQIQNGCNHRCTFCIIPYARGNSRSVPVGEIAKQLQILVDQNYKEVVLTGVDISDYGLDLPGKPTLGQMLKRILRLIPNLPRIRLSSIDVAEIDTDLLDLILHEERFMPHLHISLQSGDNMILKRMKRRHTREQLLEFCYKVRQHRPDTGFGADIIAGFPTETDEMFNNTLKLIHEAKLQYLHVFPYSERKNTPAARMPQIDKQIRKERAMILRKAGEKELYEFSVNHIGKRVSVIMEQNNIGRSENFLKLYFNSNNVKVGDIIDAKITKYENNKLFAEIV